MYKNFDPHKPYFHAVAMMLIVVGCAVLATGAVEFAYNTLGSTTYFAPSLKVIGGFVIIALGYIHLELELIRIK